jgi:hypothetical protein
MSRLVRCEAAPSPAPVAAELFIGVLWGSSPKGLFHRRNKNTVAKRTHALAAQPLR